MQLCVSVQVTLVSAPQGVEYVCPLEIVPRRVYLSLQSIGERSKIKGQLCDTFRIAVEEQHLVKTERHLEFP